MVLTLGKTGTRYGATLSIDWTGFDEVRANLKTIAERYPVEMGIVLEKEAGAIMAKSVMICPYDQDNMHDDGTPHLNETANISEPFHENQNTGVILSYGTPYAVLQHEVQEYHHDVPEQWKYLEHPINERAPYMASNMARGVNMERMLKGSYVAPSIERLLIKQNNELLAKQRQAQSKYGHLLGRFV
jgi:hypothetical protein